MTLYDTIAKMLEYFLMGKYSLVKFRILITYGAIEG